jgi:murein L,D-transpeptidase YcbB/YkuD
LKNFIEKKERRVMNRERGVIVLVLCMAITTICGCATVRSSRTPIIDPKVRVQQLEEELRQKDLEILALKEEMAKSVSSYAAPSSPSTGEVFIASSLQSSVSLKSIKIALKNAGFYTGTVDREPDPKLKNAIRAFQKARGLKADGVVGKKTWAALSRYV